MAVLGVCNWVLSVRRATCFSLDFALLGSNGGRSPTGLIIYATNIESVAASEECYDECQLRDDPRKMSSNEPLPETVTTSIAAAVDARAPTTPKAVTVFMLKMLLQEMASPVIV